MFGGELGVQAERERDKAFRVGPQAQQSASLSRSRGGDLGSLEDGNAVQLWVVVWVPCKVVCSCAALDASA